MVFTFRFLKIFGIAALVSLGVAFIPVSYSHGAQVAVGEVDISGRAVDDVFTVPVSLVDAAPENFAGFQFEIEYDATALELTGVARGALINVEDAARASGEYGDYLWALEHDAAGGVVSVAGMILVNNLASIPFARIPSGTGVLLALEFRLLEKRDILVRLLPGSEKNLLAFDPLTEHTEAAVDPPDGEGIGGASASGLGIAWQMEHFEEGEFGTLDPQAFSPDGTGFTLLQQSQAGTDPKDPAVTGILFDLATTARPTNDNFVSIPFENPQIDGLAITDAVSLVESLGGAENVGVVYKWITETQRWLPHVAMFPEDDNFEVGLGDVLMISVYRDITKTLTGHPARNKLDLFFPAGRPTGDNHVSLPYGLETQPRRVSELVTALGGDENVGVIYKWATETQRWIPHIAMFPEDDDFELNPGMPVVVSMKADNLNWPDDIDWPHDFPPLIP